MKYLKNIILKWLFKYYKKELDLIYNNTIDTKRQPYIEPKKVNIEIVQKETIIDLYEISRTYIGKEKINMLKDSAINDFLKSLSSYVDTQIEIQNNEKLIIKTKIKVCQPI